MWGEGSDRIHLSSFLKSCHDLRNVQVLGFGIPSIVYSALRKNLSPKLRWMSAVTAPSIAILNPSNIPEREQEALIELARLAGAEH